MRAYWSCKWTQYICFPHSSVWSSVMLWELLRCPQYPKDNDSLNCSLWKKSTMRSYFYIWEEFLSIKIWISISIYQEVYFPRAERWHCCLRACQMSWSQNFKSSAPHNKVEVEAHIYNINSEKMEAGCGLELTTQAV